MTERIIGSSILILCILVIRRLARGRIRPSALYCLWLLVVLRLTLPFENIPSMFSVMNPVRDAAINAPDSLKPLIYNLATGVTYRTSDPSTSLAVKAAAYDWQLVILILWIAGSLLTAAWMIYTNRRFALRLLAERRRYAGCPCKLHVYLADSLPSPCLFSWKGETAIYLTEEMAADNRMLRHILAHELCHYRHLDHVWAVVRNGLLAVYWFHPLLWIAASISRQDAEMACDEAAIRMLGEENRTDYGRTLISLVSPRPTPLTLTSISTTMASGRHTIRERIRLIAKKPRTLLPAALLLFLLITAAVGCTFTSASENPKPSTGESVPESLTEKLLTETSSQAGRPLLLEDVLDLAKRGDSLTFADFEGYDGGEDIGSGLYIRMYPVEYGRYTLAVSGHDLKEKPMYIRLQARDADSYTDIRDAELSEYIEKYPPDSSESDTDEKLQQQKEEDALNASRQVTFSEEEVEEARQAVLRYFEEEAPERELKELWYDNESCIRQRVSYLLYGRGAVNGISADDVIIFLCDFTIPADNVMEGEYTDFNLILIRDGKDGQWRLDDQGY